MRWYRAWMVTLLAGACAATPARPVPMPDALHRPALLAQARAVADAWMRAHRSEDLAFSWGEGVLAYGLLRLHRVSGDAAPRAYVARYLGAHQAAGVRVRWSDDTTPGLGAAELVLAGDDALRPLLAQVVDYVVTAPRTEAQGLVRHLGRRVPAWLAPRGWLPDAWVDSLFHFTLTLSRYTRITSEARYRDEAARQLLGFLQNLQDPVTGLVTHAYNDRPRDQQVPPFARRAFWARGNGWMLVSLVDLWHELPQGDPRRAEIGRRGRLLAEALGRAADPERGLFHTLLLDRTTYLETAGSALIVAGLARGAQVGLFGAREAALAGRGMRGLVGTLARRGDALEVTGISLGTNPNARRYARVRQRAQVSYGVGAWLLAASALLEAGALDGGQ